MSAVDDPEVRRQLRRAWEDSQPGTADAHEEGGFILRLADGRFTIERWPRGAQDEIEVPPHSDGRRGAAVILATFHTHPNPGPTYQQEPSPTDIRAVRLDPDLRHAEYEGEYVIATALVYHLAPDGVVRELGGTPAWLAARRT